MTRQDHADLELRLWQAQKYLPVRERIFGLPAFDELSLEAHSAARGLDASLERIRQTGDFT